MIVSIVIAIYSVIGGFGWVDLVWLAASTVRSQPTVQIKPITAKAPITFEETVIAMIKVSTKQWCLFDSHRCAFENSPAGEETLVPQSNWCLEMQGIWRYSLESQRILKSEIKGNFQILRDAAWMSIPKKIIMEGGEGGVKRGRGEEGGEGINNITAAVNSLNPAE